MVIIAKQGLFLDGLTGCKSVLSGASLNGATGCRVVALVMGTPCTAKWTVVLSLDR